MMASALELSCQREERKSSFRSFDAPHSFKDQQVSLTRVPSTQVSLIRKELVALTGNHFQAVILNQLLYWTQRVKDFDLLLEEERSFHPECNVSPRHGWIYKTAIELIEETMLGISHPTMRKYLKLLVDQGWIDERTHPLDKWNKTTQYRVNLRKLQADLIAIGWSLPDIYLKSLLPSSREEENLSQSSQTNVSEEVDDITKSESDLSSLHSNVINFHSNENENEPFLDSPSSSEEISNVSALHSNVKNLHSNVRNLHSYTYTENTTENKNREHRADARAGKQAIDACDGEVTPEPSVRVAALMVDLWRRYVNQEAISLTDERKRRLQSLLEVHFQNDLRLWEQFCLRVKSSPFLMGEGKRKWHVTLDWILAKGNLLKVLGGSFDDSEQIEHQKIKDFQNQQDREIRETLDSIKDPIWKNWCSQLLGVHPLTGGQLMVGDVPIKAVLTLLDVKQIAQARFKEFDGRLVWIECSDHQTLNQIENLRLRFLSVVQATYPTARSVRAQLNLTPSETYQQTGNNHPQALDPRIPSKGDNNHAE